jgi:hypothetical protein
MPDRAESAAVMAASAPRSGSSPPPEPIGIVLAKKPEKRQAPPTGR